MADRRKCKQDPVRAGWSGFILREEEEEEELEELERKKRKKDSRKEALVSLCLPREQHHQVNTGCF